MTYVMRAYDDALQQILDTGVLQTNQRTGERTLALFGMNQRYRLDECFPVVTRRKMYPEKVFAELLWFLSGSTNNNDLVNLGAKFWTPWVSEEFEQEHGFVPGSLGPVYGFQLRHFGGDYGDGSAPSGGFDQLDYVIRRIKEDRSCRRILWSLWNPNDLEKERLAPCHYSYQICIDDCGAMTGVLTQRSCDFPVGVCANVQFYSALTMMIAQQTGYRAYELVHNTVNAHVYGNQIDAALVYLRTPVIDSPKLELRKAKDIYSYTLDDFKLVGYRCGPNIRFPVAV